MITVDETTDKYYCARFIKPKKMCVFGKDYKTDNPLCGMLGLENINTYHNVFSRPLMPLVDAKNNIIPFVWKSKKNAFSDIIYSHKTDVSFDWPIPLKSVLWELRLHSYYDGSSEIIISNVTYNKLRLFLLAYKTICENNNCLWLEILEKIIPTDSLNMPKCYKTEQCNNYKSISPLKSGHCNKFIEKFI